MDTLLDPAAPDINALAMPLDSGADGDTLMAGTDRGFLLANMRALPVQPRARLTVSRILVAAHRIGARCGPEGLTLDAVAAVANVRLGTVYRYFSTPDDLIRTIVRLWVARRLARYRARFASVRFDSVDVVVEHLAAGVERALASYWAEGEVPGRVKLRLLRDYHELPHAEIWTLAGEVCAKMARDGLDPGPDAPARLAMAFASASARVKMVLLNAPQLHDSADFRAQLRTAMRDALAPASAVGARASVMASAAS